MCSPTGWHSWRVVVHLTCCHRGETGPQHKRSSRCGLAVATAHFQDHFCCGPVFEFSVAPRPPSWATLSVSTDSTSTLPTVPGSGGGWGSPWKSPIMGALANWWLLSLEPTLCGTTTSCARLAVSTGSSFRVAQLACHVAAHTVCRTAPGCRCSSSCSAWGSPCGRPRCAPPPRRRTWLCKSYRTSSRPSRTPACRSAQHTGARSVNPPAFSKTCLLGMAVQPLIPVKEYMCLHPDKTGALRDG